MLITFSGLDGAGKTTQINLLSTYLQSLGYRVTVLTMYDHVSISAVLRQALKRLPRRNKPRLSSQPSMVTSASQSFRYDKNCVDPLTVLLRQIVYLLDLCRFSLIRASHKRQRRQLLIMDRYFYDSIANIARSMGWKALYTRCFLALMPTPDVPILLDLDAHVAFQRKPEYPLAYMIERRQVYLQLFHSVPTALVIGSAESAAEVHRLIKERIQTALLEAGRKSDKASEGGADMGSRDRRSRTANGIIADPVLQRIHARAWVYLDLVSAERCNVQELDPVKGGSTGKSRLFELHAKEDFQQKVFVKTYAPREETNRNRERMQIAYQSEVKALEKLGHVFGGDRRYRLPRLLDAWDDLNTVVLDGVDAVPVTEMVQNTYDKLGSKGEREKRVREMFWSFGGWLSHLHNVTYAGESNIDVQTILALNGRLERALASRKLSGTQVGTQIARYTQRLLKLVEETHEVLEVPIAQCHGDFRLQNLMVGAEGEVWGVDMCGSRLEPVYVEVTHFLATLRIGRRKIWGEQVLRTLEHSFLLGYARGVNFRLIGRRVGLRIYRVYAYLRLLATALQRWEDRGSAGWNAWIEREWIWVKYVRPVKTFLEAAEQAAMRLQTGRH